MSTEVTKKEFLKRYLENEKDSDGKRKKKPKRKAHVSSLKIVDEDIDLKSINFGDKAEEDEGDEAPVIAEIIDERPLEVKVKELYESSRWKKLNIDEIPGSDSAETLRENESRLSETNSMSIKEEPNSDSNSYLKNDQNSFKKHRHDSDSDMSPPRVQERTSQKRHDSSVLSPRRDKRRYRSDSDTSPPRSNKQRKNKNKYDSDSDISPPRHKVSNTSASQKIHNSKNRNSDSDISPPRHRIVSKTSLQIKHSSRRHDSDSDEMPSKNQIHLLAKRKGESRSLNDYKEKDLDSDMSPPRSSSELSSKDKTKKLCKTLSGLKAGLQNSKTVQKEVRELKDRENKQLSALDEEISGRNAGTIVRDRKTGKKRDLNQEQQVKNEEDKKVKEYQQKYTEWGKGIEQTLDKKEKLIDDIYEMSKPLARYKDDEDLDERLKSIIHDDDPMSEYIKKKRQKEDTSKYPIYRGPPAPPNRFGILPGYRWDGVDRSNGFEQKYFAKINKSKAVENEAYLWSVQDM